MPRAKTFREASKEKERQFEENMTKMTGDQLKPAFSFSSLFKSPADYLKSLKQRAESIVFNESDSKSTNGRVTHQKTARSQLRISRDDQIAYRADASLISNYTNDLVHFIKSLPADMQQQAPADLNNYNERVQKYLKNTMNLVNQVTEKQVSARSPETHQNSLIYEFLDTVNPRTTPTFTTEDGATIEPMTDDIEETLNQLNPSGSPDVKLSEFLTATNPTANQNEQQSPEQSPFTNAPLNFDYQQVEPSGESSVSNTASNSLFNFDYGVPNEQPSVPTIDTEFTPQNVASGNATHQNLFGFDYGQSAAQPNVTQSANLESMSDPTTFVTDPEPVEESITIEEDYKTNEVSVDQPAQRTVNEQAFEAPQFENIGVDPSDGIRATNHTRNVSAPTAQDGAHVENHKVERIVKEPKAPKKKGLELEFD